MALATTNISTTVVQTALGSSSHSVSVLCTDANINMWSNHKPHTIVAPGSAYYDGINTPTKSHGMYRKTLTVWYII